jgi:hypothetical protein
LELLALFTALYLQAETEKKMKQEGKFHNPVAANFHSSKQNPYLDFLENPEIKKHAKSEHICYLLALSVTLCDPNVLSFGCSMASRDIKLLNKPRPNQGH